MSDRAPWFEPDGTPTEPGICPHDAIWDHEGRKWDEIPVRAALAADDSPSEGCRYECPYTEAAHSDLDLDHPYTTDPSRG